MAGKHSLYFSGIDPKCCQQALKSKKLEDKGNQRHDGDIGGRNKAIRILTDILRIKPMILTMTTKILDQFKEMQSPENTVLTTTCDFKTGTMRHL